MRAPPALDLSETALFLDVDGTLVEIAGHPEQVVVPPELPLMLERLDAATDGAFALVSGRPVEQLDQMFSPVQVSVAGLHGLDRRNRATGHTDRTAPDPEAYERAKAGLGRFVAEDPRLLLEEKRLTLALHYRNAPEQEEAAREAAEEAARASGGAFVLLVGKMVLELKPPGADKGEAIRAFMAERPFAGRRPVFVGDDVTDEAGFTVVEAAGGVTIRIGQDDSETAAAFGLTDVPAMLDWLAQQLPAGRVVA
jgi:trehalose 6-phosphate phosphatase